MNDTLPPLPRISHPEPHAYRFTDLERAYIEGYAMNYARKALAAHDAEQAQQAAGQELASLPPIDDYLPTDGPRWTTANFIACVERYATDYARAALARRMEPLTDEQIRREKPVCADWVSFRAGVRCAERIHGVGK